MRRRTSTFGKNMKRDMNLVRLILLEQEGETVDFSGYTENQIVYHAALAIEANLVHGSIIEDEHGQPRGTAILRMTWAGHDFLDAAKNDTIWKKVTGGINEKGLSLTFDLLKSSLESAIRQQIGLP